MLFSKITGHEGIKQTLAQSILDSHVAHAICFAGKEGGAQLPMALAFATMLHCKTPSFAGPCGQCASCQRYERLMHPDLHFVFPVANTKSLDGELVLSHSFMKEFRAFILESPYGTAVEWADAFGAENKLLNISVHEARQTIQTVSMKPFEAGFKVLILWLPEFLNNQAANALLKVLEEPNGQTIFLFVSNDTNRLLPTIQSRLQTIYIPPFSQLELAGMLMAEQGLTEEQASRVGRLADGDYNQAIRLLNDADADFSELFSEWMRMCYKGDFVALMSLSEKFASLGREAQKQFMVFTLGQIREAVLYNEVGNDFVRLPDSELQFIERFAPFIKFEAGNDLTRQLSEAAYHIERNGSAKIIFFDTSLHLHGLLRA